MIPLRNRALAMAAFAAALIGQGCSCQNPTASLTFTTQAPGSVAGAAMAPATVVTALDKDGKPIADFTKDVTVAIASGPSGATLSGPTTAAAVAGAATFDGLALDKAGTYTLSASASGLTSVTSAQFTVAPGADEKLAFVVEPQDTSINRALTPAVQVGILDHFGNVTHSTVTVQIQLAANPGTGTLRGTASVAATDGVATFVDLSLDQFGNGYRLGASAGTLVPVISQAFNITAPRLAYTNPTAPAKVRLVRDDVNSTDASIVLRLEAAAAFSGYSVGMDLPIDPSKIVPASFVFTPGTISPRARRPASPPTPPSSPPPGPWRACWSPGRASAPRAPGRWRGTPRSPRATSSTPSS